MRVSSPTVREGILGVPHARASDTQSSIRILQSAVGQCTIRCESRAKACGKPGLKALQVSELEKARAWA